MFKNGFDLLAGYAWKPLQEFADGCPAFQIFKESAHGYTRSAKHPRATDFAGHALYLRAGRPIQHICEANAKPISEQVRTRFAVTDIEFIWRLQNEPIFVRRRIVAISTTCKKEIGARGTYYLRRRFLAGHQPKPVRPFPKVLIGLHGNLAALSRHRHRQYAFIMSFQTGGTYNKPSNPIPFLSADDRSESSVAGHPTHLQALRYRFQFNRISVSSQRTLHDVLKRCRRPDGSLRPTRIHEIYSQTANGDIPHFPLKSRNPVSTDRPYM